MANYPIYRQVKGSPLTFAEMDGNLEWLSRTMSASIVTITGSTSLLGDLTVSNGITGSLFGTSSWAQNAPNIYNSNGTVTSNRLVILDDKQLVYRSSGSILQNYAFNIGTPTGIPTSTWPSSVIFEGEYLMSTANAEPYNTRVWGRNQTSSARNFWTQQTFADITGESTGVTNIYNQLFSARRGSPLDTSTATTATMRGVWNQVGHAYAGITATQAVINTTSQEVYYAQSLNYTGNITNVISYYAQNQVGAGNTPYTTNVTNYYGFYQLTFVVDSKSTITNHYGLFLSAPTIGTGGIIVNRWGLYAPDVAMNHHINGAMLLGTVTPSTHKLDVVGTTRMTGDTTITGSLTVSQNITGSNALITGTITAQTLVVQTVTSSILYSSGSNIFGNNLTNTQDFTGSVRITGSLSVNGASVPLGSGAAGQVTYWNGTSIVTGSNNLFWDAANSRLGIGTNSPANTLHLSAYNTTNSQVRIGSLELQSFSLNNVWLGSNIYYNAGFVVRNTGNTGMFYFLNDEGQFRMTTSLAAGTVITSTDTVQLKINSLGNFALGQAISNNRNDFTGAKLVFYGSTGNLLIGTTTDDSTNKLQVSGSSRFFGNMVITGSGATSATIALQIQNSSSQNILQVFNDGMLKFGNANNAPLLYTGGGPTINSQALTIGLNNYNSWGNGESAFTILTNTNTTTAGTSTANSLTGTFAPGSGGHNHNFVRITATINQTGGANGITRGLFIQPFITAAADWRSIEWSNNAATAPSASWGLYGTGTAPNYLGGRLAIGNVLANSIYALNVEGILNVSRATGNPALSFNNNAASSNSIAYLEATATTLSIYAHTSRTITFAAGASSGPQMTLTAAGRLLLGRTSEETFLLDVNGAARVSGSTTLQISNNAGNNSNLLVETTNGDSARLQVKNSEGSFSLQTNDNVHNITNSSTAISFQDTIPGVRIANGSGGSGADGNMLLISGTKNSFNNNSRGIFINTILTAASNNTNLIGLDINPTFSPGAFSNITSIGLRVQVGGAIIGGTVLSASAVLQADSTTQGFLPPRMTAAQRTTISNPAQGLLVYDTGSVTEGLWFYNSGSTPGWQEVLTNSGSQSISGSLTATNFTGSLFGTSSWSQNSITASNFNGTGSNGFVSNMSDTYTGTAKITDIVTLSSAEYAAIGSPLTSTLYIII